MAWWPAHLLASTSGPPCLPRKHSQASRTHSQRGLKNSLEKKGLETVRTEPRSLPTMAIFPLSPLPPEWVGRNDRAVKTALPLFSFSHLSPYWMVGPGRCCWADNCSHWKGPLALKKAWDSQGGSNRVAGSLAWANRWLTEGHTS